MQQDALNFFDDQIYMIKLSMLGFEVHSQWPLIKLLSIFAQFYKYREIPDDLKNWIVKKMVFYISLEKGNWLINYKKHKSLFPTTAHGLQYLRKCELHLQGCS